MKHFFWNIFIGIKNLYVWFPVIWKQREWDHDFFYELIEFKLNRVADFFLSDKPVILDSKKVGLQCLQGAKLIKALREEEYSDVAFEPYYQKYPSERIPKFETERITDEKGNTHIMLKDTCPDREMWKECHDKSMVLYKQYKEVLWKVLFYEYFDTWWD